ncbi:DUF1577 domain-containing protein [Leptospira gomenensis]|uniref:DUF1577 domain-containing protein n=1 Tax=Leptospira gomenensis TaxID=2484974 RepID=A0A5F1Y5U5_9LEPT|nr:DUF1577 domain-containing protein [Leptospira gomenensis]TGK28048.1 DUF1577 domain-containing protein [Leptospira gomenensis]TGK37097.1 DUF1577 domain-containing protein [Leptospira gomenensis]TGK45733.1 DUF1577 domain-containing protein [Leptospira gomenensis]TGK59672.1 DUF1577 domain-containing protein [Leptospira gomenensis]
MNVAYQKYLQAPRSWETIQDVNKIKYILKEYIHFQGLLVKESPFHQELKPMEIREDGIFVFPIDATLTNVEEELVLYRTLSKHIEIGFEVIEKTETQIFCKPVFAKIAKTQRTSPRIEGLIGKVVSHKFLIPRKELEITKVLGTSGQIILNDLNRKIKQAYPGSRLIFSSSKDLSPEEELVKKYKKPIYIPDTTALDSETKPDFAGIELLPLKEILQEELLFEERAHYFKNGKVRSLLIYPISFKNGDDLQIFAMGVVESTEGPVSEEVVPLYKEMEEIFNSRMGDSNTKALDVKQNVLNISEGGILLEVTESELIESFLHKPFFTADITFKMQAPLRFAFHIRHISQVGEIYHVGAEIVGSNDAKANMTLLKKNMNFIKTQ